MYVRYAEPEQMNETGMRVCVNVFVCVRGQGGALRGSRVAEADAEAGSAAGSTVPCTRPELN